MHSLRGSSGIDISVYRAEVIANSSADSTAALTVSGREFVPPEYISRFLAVLLVVLTHAAVIQSFSGKSPLPTSTPSNSNEPLEVSVLPISPSTPPEVRMLQYRLRRIPAAPFPTLAPELPETAQSSFAITVPATAAGTEGNQPASDLAVTDTTTLRRFCATSEPRPADNLTGSRNLEMLVRVEPSGLLSDVKVVRSSGSANLDAAIAACVLAHGQIETHTHDSKPSAGAWRRIVWNNLN